MISVSLPSSPPPSSRFVSLYEDITENSGSTVCRRYTAPVSGATRKGNANPFALPLLRPYDVMFLPFQ